MRTINKIKKNCVTCGREVSVWPYRNTKRNFCSRICLISYIKTNIKGKPRKNHALYKGNNASYEAKHARIYRMLGKAIKCENINCNQESQTFHWANISGHHLHNKEDWIQLCAICHKAFDGGRLHLNNIKYGVRASDLIIHDDPAEANICDGCQ